MGQGSSGRVYGEVVALNVRDKDGKLVRTYDTNTNGQSFNTTNGILKDIHGAKQYSAVPGTLTGIAQSLRRSGFRVTAYTENSLSKRRKKDRARMNLDR